MFDIKHKVKKIFKAIQYMPCCGLKSFLLLFTPAYMQGKLIKINGVYLRGRTSDIGIFEQIFLDRQYDFNLNTPEIIVDCGANIGLGTCFFKKKWPNAKVISVEPETHNYELLNKNIEGYTNVIALKAGIWNKSCKLNILDESVRSDAFMLKEEKGNTDNTSADYIDAITISDIIKQYDIQRIDLLKIDIEGSETIVFDSSAHEWLPYVGTLVIELHDEMKKGCSKAFFSTLSAYDYKLTPCGENLIITFDHGQ